MKRLEEIKKEMELNQANIESNKLSLETKKNLIQLNRELLDEMQTLLEEQEKEVVYTGKFYNFTEIEKEITHRVFYWLEMGYVLDTEENRPCYGGSTVRYFVKNATTGNRVSIDLMEESYEDSSSKLKDLWVRDKALVIREHFYRHDNRSHWENAADDTLYEKAYYALPTGSWFDKEKATYVDSLEFAVACQVKHDERRHARWELERKSRDDSEVKFKGEVVERIMRNHDGFKTKRAKDVREVKRVHTSDGQLSYVIKVNSGKGVNTLYIG